MEGLILLLLKVNPSERPNIDTVIEKAEDTLKHYSATA